MIRGTTAAAAGALALCAAAGASAADKTELSRKAEGLKMKQPECGVIDRLGPPDWFVRSGEDPEASPASENTDMLVWDNGLCSNVVVLIDADSREVKGWTPGTAFCSTQSEDADLFSLPGKFRVGDDRRPAC